MRALKSMYNTMKSQKIKDLKGFFSEKEWTLVQEAIYYESKGIDILKDDYAIEKGSKSKSIS